MKNAPVMFIIVLMMVLVCPPNLPLAEEIAPQNDDVIWYDGKLLTLEGKGWIDTESDYDRLPAKAKNTIVPSIRTVIIRCSELPDLRINGR